MKNYIINRQAYFRIVNEGWLDQKIKSTTSDIIKAIITNYVKSFNKLFTTFKDKWQNIKQNDIRFIFLQTLNTSFDSVYNEVDKITDPQDISNILDNIDTLNNLLKEDCVKKLNSDLKDNTKLNSILNIINTLFESINSNIKSYEEEFNSKIESIELLEKKKKEVNNLLNTLFKNIEEEIKNIDLEKIWDSEVKSNLLFKIGDLVKYKTENYDDSKPKETQQDNIADGEIKSIEGEKITILNKNINKEVVKDSSEIITDVDDNLEKTQTELKTELGKLKESPKQLNKVLDFIKNLKV